MLIIYFNIIHNSLQVLFQTLGVRNALSDIFAWSDTFTLSLSKKESYFETNQKNFFLVIWKLQSKGNLFKLYRGLIRKVIPWHVPISNSGIKIEQNIQIKLKFTF